MGLPSRMSFDAGSEFIFSVAIPVAGTDDAEVLRAVVNGSLAELDVLGGSHFPESDAAGAGTDAEGTEVGPGNTIVATSTGGFGGVVVLGIVVGTAKDGAGKFLSVVSFVDRVSLNRALTTMSATMDTNVMPTVRISFARFGVAIPGISSVASSIRGASKAGGFDAVRLWSCIGGDFGDASPGNGLHSAIARSGDDVPELLATARGTGVETMALE